MNPLVLEIDYPPLGGWRGNEIDHSGMQLSVLENRPLVKSHGILHRLDRVGKTWIARLNHSAVWSDGMAIEAWQVRERIDEVSRGSLGWPLRYFAHETRIQTKAQSKTEVRISGLPATIDIAPILASTVYSPRRPDAVTGVYRATNSIPAIRGALLRQNSTFCDNGSDETIVLTTIDEYSDNIELWECDRLDVTCSTGTFPASLSDARENPNWIEQPTCIGVYLLLNADNELFGAAERRRAVANAVNRHQLVEAAGFLADPLIFPTDIITRPVHRRSLSKSAVRVRIGFDNEKVSLCCSDFAPNPKVSYCVAEQLEGIGLHADVHIRTWPEFVSALSKKGYDLAVVLVPTLWRTPLGAVLQAFAVGGGEQWYKSLQLNSPDSLLDSDKLETLYQDMMPSVPLMTVRAGTFMSERALQRFRVDENALLYPREYDQ